jgi:hypothetical protein
VALIGDDDQLGTIVAPQLDAFPRGESVQFGVVLFALERRVEHGRVEPESFSLQLPQTDLIGHSDRYRLRQSARLRVSMTAQEADDLLGRDAHLQLALLQNKQRHKREKHTCFWGVNPRAVTGTEMGMNNGDGESTGMGTGKSQKPRNGKNLI